MSDKKKLLLIIIAILGVILIGIGVGYGAYKIQENKYEINDNGDKQVDKDNKEEKTEDEVNETVKKLNEYVQSITNEACVYEEHIKKIFSGNNIFIKDLTPDVQFAMISNYYLKNYSINFMKYYYNEENFEAAFDKNLIRDAFEITTNLYKVSDLENLFKKIFSVNSKYYYGITETQSYPTYHFLKDDNNYMALDYRGGCGPSYEIHNEYLKFEKTNDEIILYYGFGYYNFEEEKYYTGNMNNLILLESNVDYDSSSTMNNKYKDKLTQFKVRFKKVSNGNYYYYSIDWS